MARPSFWTRLTDRLNVLLWRTPLPERPKKRLSGLIYRNPAMGARRARETLDALAAAGLIVCCMGGWGIDALVGEQTRKHRDLDVIVAREQREAALDALAGLGYEVWYEQSADQPFGERVVVRDPALRVVDVHPVELAEAKLSFASGTIAGSPVRCLSAEEQIRAQQGFRSRLLHERRSQRVNAALARQLIEADTGSLE